MRGEIVYRVYGVHAGRSEDTFFGAYQSVAEAEAAIAKLQGRREWAKDYHNCGFVFREQVVETDFEIPFLPKPRDRYAVKGTPKPNRSGTWNSTIVEVFRRGEAGPEKICEYERNYRLLHTFEPFRQGAREYALISRSYTQTAVLDLHSGSIVAEEADANGNGFCPVGFYVPDWWDVHDGTIIPGSKHWGADKEWPTGLFGFVWGCHWGDDFSWKVQYLDLSEVRNGILRRDERFGYVELATAGYASPCFAPDAAPGSRSTPPSFIRAWMSDGMPRVSFAVEMRFHLASGQPEEWQRLRVADFE